MTITIVTVVAQIDTVHMQRFFMHMQAIQRYYGQKLILAPPLFLKETETELTLASPLHTTILVLLLSEDLLAVLDLLLNRKLVAPETSPALRVLPVVLRPCSWNEPGSMFRGRWPLPRNHTPISLWRDPDSAWYDVVKDIRLMLEDFYQADQNQQRPLSQSPQAAPLLSRTPQAASPHNPAPMQPATTDRANRRDHHPTRPGPPPSPTATLLIYAKVDKRIAQQCLLHLKTAGLEVIDAQNMTAGSIIPNVFRTSVQRSWRAVFLISADFLAEIVHDERRNIPALAVSTIPATLLAHSFLVVVRPCAYKRLLSELDPHPQVIIAPSNSSFRHLETFWLNFARRLQAKQ